jgi:rod shape-determining protein MreD
MSRTIFTTILQFILISLAQILLLNNIQLFGYMQPLIYIWFIILLPNSFPKWIVMILGFLMGFTMDVFSAQLGFHTATATLTATIKPMMLSWFVNNFDNNTFRPSIAEMGFLSFLGFTSSMVFLHTTIYILIESFSFAEILNLLLRILISSLISIGLILISDALFIKERKD